MPAIAQRYELPDAVPVANQVDFSEQGTFDLLTYEFSRFQGKRACDPPSRDWWREIWQNRLDTWGDTLGPTLRKGIPVPAAEGAELEQLFQHTWNAVVVATHGLQMNPPNVTAQQLTSGKVETIKRDDAGNARVKKDGTFQTQSIKLTRFLTTAITDRLTTQHGAQWHSFYLYNAGKEFPASLVSQIFDRINQSNGAYIVLSANPLDILNTSEYSDTITSCHQWRWNEQFPDGQQHASGNFAYACDPGTLVVYTYAQTKPFAIGGGFGTYPNKKYRQLVFTCHDKQVAWFGRAFPQVIPETQHQPLRRLVAAAMTGEDPATVAWKYATSDTIKAQFCNKYTYPDAHHGILKLGDKIDAQTLRLVNGDGCSHIVPAPVCPCCNEERNDRSYRVIICPNCQKQTITLASGERIRVNQEQLREYVAMHRYNDPQEYHVPITEVSTDLSTLEPRVKYLPANGVYRPIAEFDVILQSLGITRKWSPHHNSQRCKKCSLAFASSLCTYDNDGSIVCRYCFDERPLPLTREELAVAHAWRDALPIAPQPIADNVDDEEENHNEDEPADWDHIDADDDEEEDNEPE